MLRPIVAGVDGSPESLTAAAWAAREAVRRGLPLHVVHASDRSPEGASAVTTASLARRRAGRILLRKAEEHILRACPRVRLTAEWAEGQATAALLRAADRAELLVLGSRGQSGFTGFLIGSVAQSVVARAARPVVLVQAGEVAQDEHLPDADGNPSTRTPCRDIVLGIDLRDPCDEVIAFAFECARVREARLRAVHAWHNPSPLTLGPGEIALVEEPQREEEWRGFLSAVLQTWREKFAEVEVDELVTESRPNTALVRASSGAGLLVVGRRTHEGRTGPRTGPVTRAAIHHAHCPVAVVTHA